MNKKRQNLGEQGEQLAREYLEQNGYRILETNLENDRGEIDLLAYETEPEVFVFVEVRTRSSDFLHGEGSIGPRKKQKITGVASRFLARRDALQVSYRFDVIGVTMKEDEEPKIRHHRSAFSS